MIKVVYNSNENNLSTRDSNAIHVTGIKVTYKFRWPDAITQAQPLRCRWALIANRNTQQPTDTNQDVSTTNFFDHIAPGEPDATEKPFPTDDSCVLAEKRRINPSQWMVLSEGRFYLSRDQTAAMDDTATPSPTFETFDKDSFTRYKTISRYIPLNTQMRFADETENYPVDKNIWFVCWFYAIDKTSTQTTPTAAKVEAMWEHATYFREMNE
jgi:hypothetical protein